MRGIATVLALVLAVPGTASADPQQVGWNDGDEGTLTVVETWPSGDRLQVTCAYKSMSHPNQSSVVYVVTGSAMSVSTQSEIVATGMRCRVVTAFHMLVLDRTVAGPWSAGAAERTMWAGRATICAEAFAVLADTSYRETTEVCLPPTPGNRR